MMCLYLDGDGHHDFTIPDVAMEVAIHGRHKRQELSQLSVLQSTALRRKRLEGL